MIWKPSGGPLRAVWLIPLFMAARCMAFQQGPLHAPEDRVIHYNESDDLADPVAALRNDLASGKAKLDFEPAHGYLVSLLRLLKVPISSQALVFSKTSLQSELVSPKTPRALYFNDNVYVSWVPGGQAIDVSAVDPKKGPIFYTLDQRIASPPRFTRDNQCFQCHLGPKTLNVPGHLLRSMVTAQDGYPLSQVDGFTIGHGSPMQYRWGGWYVTAAHAGFVHLGNSFLQDRNHAERTEFTGNLANLRERVAISKYLSSGSDVVALLVLAHQVKMHNLITRASYETRYALDRRNAEAKATAGKLTELTEERIAHVGEPLLEYLLFRDEAPLTGPIKGTSTFAEDFQQGGPRDSKGRSLRELDLKTRLFRYPCSYLIYSPAFDSLPPELKRYLWRRLFEILSGKERSGEYAAMRDDDREAVFEILRETKPEFAASLRANKR